MAATATNYDKPVRRCADLTELAGRVRFFTHRALLLCETPQQCETHARRTVAELGDHALALDATGMTPREFCEALYATLASRYEWPALDPYRPSGVFSQFDDEFAARHALTQTAFALPRRRGPHDPTLVVWGASRQVARLFAAWRDEFWGVRHSWLLFAPYADKNQYLLCYSDSFFYDGGLHRLDDAAG